MTNEFSSILTKVAEDVLGIQQYKIQPWITEEIPQLCDQQETLKQVKNKIGVEAYKEVNREIRNWMREAKEAWIQNKCCQLKDSMSYNKTKDAYHILKDIMCPQQMNMTCSLLSRCKMPDRQARGTCQMDRILF